MNNLADANAAFAHFHCPMPVCSSVACIADIDNTGVAVKLVCSLKHVYWVPVKELSRVDPYWPGASSARGA